MGERLNAELHTRPQAVSITKSRKETDSLMNTEIGSFTSGSVKILFFVFVFFSYLFLEPEPEVVLEC